VADALAVALLEAREDAVGGVDVAAADHVVEAQPQRFELGDVRGEEIAALAVHEIEEFVEHLGREAVVDAGATEVRLLEDRTNLPGDHALAIGRGQRTGGQGGRARGRTGGGAQRQQRDGQRRDGQPDGGGTGSFVHRGRGDLWSDGASSRLSIQG
jgi:hypothetical protein